MIHRNRLRTHSKNVWFLMFMVSAFFITAYVLFMPPMPGVADQGDFQRVMDVTGLEDISNPSIETESRYFKYVTTSYHMSPVDPLRIAGLIPTTSMLYPVTLAKALCRISGYDLFNTRVLAIVYSFMYIIALTLCLKWIGIQDTLSFIFLSVLFLIILLDGNYLVWFNSLYGEPMMIIGLLFFIAAILYTVKKKSLPVLRKPCLFLLHPFFFWVQSFSVSPHCHLSFL